jgi:hypothetical protein
MKTTEMQQARCFTQEPGNITFAGSVNWESAAIMMAVSSPQERYTSSDTYTNSRQALPPIRCLEVGNINRYGSMKCSEQGVQSLTGAGTKRSKGRLTQARGNDD